MPRGCMARRGGPCTRPGVSAQPGPPSVGLERCPRGMSRARSSVRSVPTRPGHAVCADTPGARRPCCGSRAVCPGCGPLRSLVRAVTRARSPHFGLSSYDRSDREWFTRRPTTCGLRSRMRLVIRWQCGDATLPPAGQRRLACRSKAARPSRTISLANSGLESVGFTCIRSLSQALFRATAAG